LAEIATACEVQSFRAGDGYVWRYRRFAPPDPKALRAHVVAIHGVRSHGGWYEHSCGWLSQSGYQVFFLDRRGSGMNEAARGDAPGFRRLLSDIAEFLTHVREHEARRPIFLVGISWGGKLALALQRRNPGLVDGLVLLCPGIYARVKPPWTQRLAIVWSRLVSPGRLFPVPLNDPELFTASPRWRQFVADDPLGVRQATARFLIESVRLDGYLRFVPRHVSVPVLLLLAEHDRIIDNARTRRLMERLASADKMVLEYAGAHHTLEFEPDPEVFLRDLRRWLEQREQVSS
jgi:alpha-beta hydrolase superfamily lysophospholipase